MKKQIAMAAIVIMGLVAPMVGNAAIYSNPVEGRLKAVYSDFITLSVYPDASKSADANQLDNGEFAVKVVPDTKFENFSAMGDLKQGNKLSVEYTEDRNKKIVATVITKLTDDDTIIVETIPANQTTTTTTTTTNSGAVVPVVVEQ